MTTALATTALTPAELDASTRAALFAIFSAHYDHVDRAGFEADLEGKDHLLLLSDAVTGAPCGFSTQRIIPMMTAGGPVRFLFSGDTIIRRENWGSQALARTWGEYAGARLAEAPATPLYWFLISKGYRTYRYLPVFFHEFYPRAGIMTPASQQALLDQIAQQLFAPFYDPCQGLVVHPQSRGQLIPELAAIPPGRDQDPDTRFFLEMNPGAARGDELACLARICPDNFKPVGRRWVEAGLVAGRVSAWARAAHPAPLSAASELA